VHLAMMLLLAAIGRTDPADGAQAFARLKQLEGNWKGTYTWFGGRSDSGDLTAAYRIGGFGSTVLATPDAPHVHGLTVHLIGADHAEKIELTRTS
jgi:hypothetical protein